MFLEKLCETETSPAYTNAQYEHQIWFFGAAVATFQFVIGIPVLFLGMFPLSHESPTWPNEADRGDYFKYMIDATRCMFGIDLCPGEPLTGTSPQDDSASTIILVLCYFVSTLAWNQTMLAIFAQGGATLFLIAVTLCVPLANVFQEIKFFAGSTYTGFTLEGFSYFNMGLVALGNFVYISAVGMTSELEGGGFIFRGFSKAITDVDRSIATSNILSKEWQIRPEHLELVEYICRGNNDGTLVFKGRFRGCIWVAAKRFFVGPAADTSSIDNENAPTLMQIKREANIMTQLHHRNLIQLIGATDSAPHYFLCTEYMDAGSLYDLIYATNHNRAQERAVRALLCDREAELPLQPNDLPVELVVALAKDIASGMLYLHALKLAHHDLKPPNVMLNQKGEVKIIDFGLAKVHRCRGKKRYRSFPPVEVRGTPSYAAPEVFGLPGGAGTGEGGNNESSVSTTLKVDVYSFAIMLWEMMARVMPYDEIDHYTEIMQVVHGKVSKECVICSPASTVLPHGNASLALNIHRNDQIFGTLHGTPGEFAWLLSMCEIPEC